MNVYGCRCLPLHDRQCACEFPNWIINASFPFQFPYIISFTTRFVTRKCGKTHRRMLSLAHNIPNTRHRHNFHIRVVRIQPNNNILLCLMSAGCWGNNSNRWNLNTWSSPYRALTHGNRGGWCLFAAIWNINLVFVVVDNTALRRRPFMAIVKLCSLDTILHLRHTYAHLIYLRIYLMQVQVSPIVYMPTCISRTRHSWDVRALLDIYCNKKRNHFSVSAGLSAITL